MLKRYRILGERIVVLLLPIHLIMCPAMPKPPGAQPLESLEGDWTANDSMRLYFEAITTLRKNALGPLTSRQIVGQTLKAYLQSLDPFSNYLAPEEYAKYKLSQQSHYAGVGMEIEKNQTGQTICTPYPEGPAARAGIEPGDILEAVDDIGTVGESILSLAAKIRGQQGTEVRLSVLNRSGQRKHVRISRAALQSRSVFIERPRGAVPIIRVLAFTNGTPRELKEAVDTLSGSSTVVIDLRGNPGGSLYSAIDAATLFLARGQKIAGIQTQKGLKEYRSDFSAAYPSPRLYLWQDEHTASAAEVFIAALCENQRAASIGRKTAGKGTIQEILALSDGSALYLTTGRLQTPSGTAYHGVGLAPSYPLAAAPAKTEDYRLKVKALMGE